MSCQLIDIDHVDSYFDTTTLAREQLQMAESQFRAIQALLETPHGIEHAKRLAFQASLDCSRAAHNFHEQAEALEAQGVWL